MIWYEMAQLHWMYLMRPRLTDDIMHLQTYLRYIQKSNKIDDLLP